MQTRDMSTTPASAVQERVLEDGSRYSGDFVDGKRHGTGANTFPNGVRYEGQWVNDEPHGMGVMILPCGTTSKRSEWKFGRPVGSLTFENKDFSFTASFSGPEIAGEVLFQFSPESSLFCMFEKGKPVGEGRYKPADAEHELIFKWSDLPNWDQIKATIAIAEIAKMAQRTIEGA